VSYHDAVAFCAWLSERESREYRLPTEAEWEYAARGDDGREYPWGDAPPAERGTYRCNLAVRARKGAIRDGYRHAAPVMSYTRWASPGGCHDMAGNLAEWCLDWYDAEYYRAEEADDPKGPAAGRERVIRGGSWRSDERGVRSAARAACPPDAALPTIGFRVVLEVPLQEGR
jgi:iron(II)-dependent oxidoreductase